MVILCIKMAMKSTVVVHDSTFDLSLKKKALENLHSTFKDAYKVGKICKAEFTVLSHFS